MQKSKEVDIKFNFLFSQANIIWYKGEKVNIKTVFEEKELTTPSPEEKVVVFGSNTTLLAFWSFELKEVKGNSWTSKEGDVYHINGNTGVTYVGRGKLY